MKVAFVGKAGCGKSEMAKYLKRRYGFSIASFALPFKMFASEMLGRALDKKTDRVFLQAMGDGGRQADKEIWIRRMGLKLQDLKWAKIDNIVVDDCRYLNEAIYLRDQGFILIKLIGRGWDLPDDLKGHVSEKELEDITPHYVVDTGGTVANSLSQVIRCLEKNGFRRKR